MIIHLKVYYYWLVFILFLVSIFSCSNERALNEKVVIINPKVQLPKDWLDESILNDISYFPLENANSLPLGNLRKFIILDTLFISTYKNRNGIYFHNIDGKFLHIQNTTGKGPLEFNEVNDFAKYDDKHILINDPEKRAILKYNLHERKVIEEYKTDLDIFAMIFHNDQLFFVGNDYENGIVQRVENFNFKDKKTLIKGTKLSNYVVTSRPFEQISNDKIAINVSFLDTIYIYNSYNRKIEKKYAIGKEATSLSKYSDEEIMGAPRQKAGSKFEKVLIPWGFVNILQDYLIFTVIPSNKCVVIDLNDDTSFFMDFKNNTGKLSYLESGSFPGIIKNREKEVLSVFFISDVKPTRTNESSPNFIKHYNKLYEENFQNPVIAQFKMK